MAAYRAPLKDIQFLLNDVFDVGQVFASMPDTAEVTDDLISAIVEEAGKIAEGLLAPINQSGDQESCHFVDGTVTTPKGFKEAYKAYAEGGWSSLTGDVNYGGQGMPKMLSAVIEEMSFAANSSFALYTILNTGATLTLSSHGSDELQNRYLPKMYAGTWTGTMCLTEPHAGTDLGMIKSKAVAQADGSYLITGTKIFITAGEHDLTENIIHLVLAKLPDAPPGPRGISLFLVPKFQVDDAGELNGIRNGVACGSIEHKMGIKASATCVMNFDSALGYLVVVPDYRLVPEVEYPEFLVDCAEAVRWVLRNSAEHGGDPTLLVLAGHSAGAYNAAALALDPAWLGAERQAIAGVIGLSGPYDFYPFDGPISQRVFGKAEDPEGTQPINHVDASAPPMLLISGERDELVLPRNSVHLGAALTAAGRPARVVIYPRLKHAGTLFALGLPLRWLAPVLEECTAFLACVTVPRRAALPLPAGGDAPR